MRCYYCDADTRVVKTRDILNGHGITRTRECLGPAKHRFNTRESAPPRLDITALAVRQTGSKQLNVRFDPDRLYRDVTNGVLTRLSLAQVEEVVENATAALARAVEIYPLNRAEEQVFPDAKGWIWDHQIADVVEHQLQRYGRMAMVLYALSTRGRKDRPGRDGWDDASQVLSWIVDRFPTLPESTNEKLGKLPHQTWRHPGAPAPVPRTIIKRPEGNVIRERQRTFDRAQFVRSIRLAVIGRFPEGEREAQIELMAEWVLWGFAGQSTVLSSQVSAAVLECLRRVDDVAYLRWSAIMKGVESVADFAEEARGLVRWPSPHLQLQGAVRHSRESAERG